MVVFTVDYHNINDRLTQRSLGIPSLFSHSCSFYKTGTTTAVALSVYHTAD